MLFGSEHAILLPDVHREQALTHGIGKLMQFEWDPDKAVSNLQKHQVSFEEAQTVFANPLAVIFGDEARSQGEPREIIIGACSAGRLLLVCFIERVPGVIRIISARAATRRERRDYEENKSP